MRVALFGGTGFVGSYMVGELLDDGHEPVLLVREGSEQKVHRENECRIVIGDISDAGSIQETLSGSEAVIYLIGIVREFRRKGISYEALHFEGAKRSMQAAQELGVRRFILMSANGVKPDGHRIPIYQVHGGRIPESLHTRLDHIPAVGDLW